MTSQDKQKHTDLRQFHRIIFKGDAVLAGDNKTFPCTILDLSLKGCLLRFDFGWTEDMEQTYLLTLQLSDEVAIKMELQASHILGNAVGFKCLHIDLESISNLRRLVELNLGDSHLLERDLIALCSLLQD